MFILKKLLRKLFRIVSSRDTSMEGYISQLRKIGVVIGENNYIGRNVSFGRGGRDPIEVGNDCVITGCTILGHDASPALFVSRLNKNRSMNNRISLKRKTIIKDKCFIGVGAVIMPGVIVGPESIVAAGAIVTKDVQPRTIIGGNPAKVIGSIDDFIAKHEQQIEQHPEWYPGL